MSKLHYLFRKTDRSKPSKATLVVMHGYGANEFDLLGIADYFKEPLTVLSFRAPLDLDWGGHAWYHLSQEANRLVGDDESRKESEELLLEQLPAILDETESDAKNIYLMGFSQGAAMCYSLVGRHDLAGKGIGVKGVIALSGYIPHDVNEPLAEKQFDKLPIFMSHGSADELIEPIALTKAKDTFTKLGAEVEGKIYPMGHSISDEVLADMTAWLSRQLAE